MIDLNKYKEFVCAVEESNNVRKLTDKLHEPINSIMTGGIGLASEGGEFNEIVKKCVFQGKPLNDETIFHMKRELGDIMWYWVNALEPWNCPNEVVDTISWWNLMFIILKIVQGDL